MHRILLFALPVIALASETVLIRKTDGAWIEGKTEAKTIDWRAAGGQPAKLAIAQVLSVHSGTPASSTESARIQSGLAAVQGAVVAQRDQAIEDLTVLGIPVITPLLDAYKDTDQHEPRPLYRLFERIIPSLADGFERGQSLVRLRGGVMQRGELSGSIVVDGKKFDWTEIRFLAVRQRSVERNNVFIHSIRHSTQIEYFDTGVVTTQSSMLDVNARGFVRLSFKEDGWASDPNGLTKPGSPAYQSNLWEGQPFGALVGRIGSTGAVFFAGKSLHKTAPKAGRLQLAINDNRHWQNNLGGFTVTVRVSNAYDAGESQ